MDEKQMAASKAASLIQNNWAIGLGAGSTMAYMADSLKDKQLALQLFTSSAATKITLEKNGFVVGDISKVSFLDMYFDGCDQFDKNLNALKSGGGIHTMEKLLASMAKEFVLVGDESKYAEQLETRYPIVIEVLPQAMAYVSKKIHELFNNVKLEIRQNNTTRNPVITEHNNYLADLWFETFPNLSDLNTAIKSITGVVETSLFYNLATMAIVAGHEGVRILEKKD